MSVEYNKLYATLLGRTDAALTFLEKSLDEGTCDREHMQAAAALLRSAIAEVEDLYLEESE